MHQALEDAGIKLDCVAADIVCNARRDIALVAGETDPDVLAELARKQMRKIPALRDALTGHFDSHHRCGSERSCVTSTSSMSRSSSSP